MRDSRILLVITAVLILASLVVLAILVQRGVGRPQNAVPSKAAEVDPTKCQGNPNAPAKCFDCNKTPISGVESVDTLDYGCFFKYYGQNVGKN